MFTDPQPAGSIDDRLRAALHAARFVIADLTHGSAGAYWEAGFGEGLGLPVIYSCREDAWEQQGTHFDTNHLNTIIWDPEDLKGGGPPCSYNSGNFRRRRKTNGRLKDDGDRRSLRSPIPAQRRPRRVGSRRESPCCAENASGPDARANSRQAARRRRTGDRMKRRSRVVDSGSSSAPRLPAPPANGTTTILRCSPTE